MIRYIKGRLLNFGSKKTFKVLITVNKSDFYKGKKTIKKKMIVHYENSILKKNDNILLYKKNIFNKWLFYKKI
ncbi:hypothetical protein [Candidatus Vidania fulgoroideorum]